MVTRSDTLCRSAGESQLFLTWHRRSYRARATAEARPLRARDPEAQSAFHWIDLTLRRGRSHARTKRCDNACVPSTLFAVPSGSPCQGPEQPGYAILSTHDRAVARPGDQDRCLSPVSAANRLS